MKRIMIIIPVLFILLLTACGSSTPQATQANSVPSLLVSDGSISKTYTRADLEALGKSEATFKDVTYVGVSVTTLLQVAGFNVSEIKAVKAVASDGYTINYDPSQFFATDVIVAYAQTDGDLTTDDGSFRMVLPNAEGKLNVRKLTELQVIK